VIGYVVRGGDMKSTWYATFLILGLGLSTSCGDDSDKGGDSDEEADVGPKTGALCDSSLTYDTDIKPLMTKYCISCHAKSVPVAQRNGAPTDHNFETQAGVLAETTHIDEEAGSGPNATNTMMPPPAFPNYPAPTTAERATLSKWIACQPASE
jgi:uncharacterized membrane protein